MHLKYSKKKKKDLDLIFNMRCLSINTKCDDITNIIKGKKLDKDEKLDHKVDPIWEKPRTSIPSNSGRIKPGHQPT